LPLASFDKHPLTVMSFVSFVLSLRELLVRWSDVPLVPVCPVVCAPSVATNPNAAAAQSPVTARVIDLASFYEYC